MVTIADVARAAGVSPSTVSYVLSGKRSISEGTRRRVERSIRELGYHPNAGARALASSRTNVLALVAPLRADVNVPVVMQFVGGVVTRARAHDHDVLLLTEDEGPDGLRRVAGSALADAVIVMDVEAAEPRLPVLRSLPLPAVLIGVPDEPHGLACVDLDFTAAGAACVGHLAELGHRAIALVGPSPAVYARGTSYAGRFLRGFRAAVAQRAVRAAERPCPPSYDGLRACLDDVLGQGVTALVVHNEAVLGPLLPELARRGLRVPEDISVLAVCPADMAEFQAVPLSSVDIPSAELGGLAVELAMSAAPPARVRLLPPRLTSRASTAPPRTATPLPSS
ncbi:LacI family DNA-binding transcriptional regulator [Saccharothrix coeruleofusca]|uniref:LacI family DNA-binding transcriptional regulator n=1 Tax=Saccharothrix coeruleofusca TaxID=33919 RepID=UPI00166FE0A8|nr:LacI family DNA-binding transcriptional regulator [Saccharothrix coeruleofusca]